jgi:uncharacterized SAM-dependent methyltransferase
MLNIDQKTKKEIIEKNLLGIANVKQKTYMNNSYSVEIDSEKNVNDFEKQFQRNLISTINKHFEDQNIDPSKYNRSVIYSISNTKNNILINF